ncbi:MAG: Hsp70 family protein [Melioribacteraceae bacterium]
MPDYYFGIDLGTTNSVISYGTIDPNTNQLITRIIKVKMLDKHQDQIEKEKLPSFIYFNNDNTPIIGEYAKYMYSMVPHKVVKSIKSKMGEAYTVQINDKSYTPEELSSLILKKLASAAKEFFGFEPKDVIITVPASFDTDKRYATLKAAKLAGFNVENTDGTFKNILLAEPRAALYDFINRQNKGEFPTSLIDFSKDKYIMVFDLGGGTLDVSYHYVHRDNNSGFLEIDDIAVSRYTQLGGDNFDTVLANHLFQSFKKNNRIENMSDFDMNITFSQFIDIAEDAKIKLSNLINERKSLEMDFEDVKIDIRRGQLYDNKSLDYSLSFKEYEKIISPLLAWDLKFDDYKNLNKISNNNNIIYPILDVLEKAKIKLKKNPNVDAVLLNGGMTKLYFIEKRLKAFFGFNPITVGDQDLSVAKGASVYHYNLKRGIVSKTILNDTIGIEIDGGYVKHLAQAGVSLPYKTGVISDFVIKDDNTTYIDIPIYLGRANDTNPPNRKIAERRVRFNSPLNQGAKIELQLYIDESNIIQLTGWEKNNPQEKFKIEVLPGKNNGSMLVSKQKNISNFNLDSVPSGKLLDVISKVDEYVKLCKDHSRSNLNDNHKRIVMKKIKDIERELIQAQNYEQIVNRILDVLNNQPVNVKSRMIYLLGRCVMKYPALSVDILNVCVKFLDVNKLQKRSDKYFNLIVRNAVETIGKTGLNIAETHLINLLNCYPNSISNSILISLGKVGNSVNCIATISKYIISNNKGERIAAFWALGKVGSREKENPIPINNLRSVISDIQKQLLFEPHFEAIRKAIYALGEICDRRDSAKDIISEQASNDIIKSIRSVSMKYPYDELIQRLANLAISMINGDILTTNQKRILLALRNEFNKEQDNND